MSTKKKYWKKEYLLKMMQTIIDRNFWYNLINMIEISKLLYNCQVTFKFGNTCLGYVI